MRIFNRYHWKDTCVYCGEPDIYCCYYGGLTGIPRTGSPCCELCDKAHKIQWEGYTDYFIPKSLTKEQKKWRKKREEILRKEYAIPCYYD